MQKLRNAEAVIGWERDSLTLRTINEFQIGTCSPHGMEFLVLRSIMDIVLHEAVVTDSFYNRVYQDAAKLLVKGWCN